MKSLTKYVDQLPGKVIFQIIQDHELLEKQNFIGECSLRTHAENLLKLFGISDSTVLLWMDRLAMECYRNYAKKYIVSNDLKNLYKE